jgi:hypothetical protein
VGAAGGGGVQAARGPLGIHLGPEARLRFQLASPLSVSPTAESNRGNTNSVNNSAGNGPYSSPNSPSSSSTNDTYGDAAPVDTPQGDRPVLKRRPTSPNDNSPDQPN